MLSHALTERLLVQMCTSSAEVRNFSKAVLSAALSLYHVSMWAISFISFDARQLAITTRRLSIVDTVLGGSVEVSDAGCL